VRTSVALLLLSAAVHAQPLGATYTGNLTILPGPAYVTDLFACDWGPNSAVNPLAPSRWSAS
jgi:hypothetical protein